MAAGSPTAGGTADHRQRRFDSAPAATFYDGIGPTLGLARLGTLQRMIGWAEAAPILRRLAAMEGRCWAEGSP